MIVLGIDPGSRFMGWGVLRVAGTKIDHVAHGVLRADESLSLAKRLVIIDDGLRELCLRFQPAEAGVESIFFAKDATAAAKLGHARGVILLNLQRHNIEIHEYPPALVKRAVGASGRADKAQVARIVQAFLRLKEIPPTDASDALAIAIAHVNSAPVRAIAKAHAAAAAASAARPSASRSPAARAPATRSARPRP